MGDRGMKWRAAVRGVLLFVLGLAAMGPVVQGQAPVLTSDGVGNGTVAIDGAWQFHLGDDASFGDPGIDDATGHGGWEQITADAPWGTQGHRSYVGYAWYRRHVHLSPAAGAPQEFSMYIARIDDAYEVYWNGKLVGANGKMPPHPVYYFSQDPQTFNLGPVRDGVLAFRVWKGSLTSFDSGEQGGFYSPPGCWQRGGGCGPSRSGEVSLAAWAAVQLWPRLAVFAVDCAVPAGLAARPVAAGSAMDGGILRRAGLHTGSSGSSSPHPIPVGTGYRAADIELWRYRAVDAAVVAAEAE